MLTGMQFMPKLGKFLKDNKVIYTVRKYYMVDKEVEAEWVGPCRRTYIGTINSKEELEPYTKDSGFKTAEDWWVQIRKFVPRKKDTLYLYRVEKET